MFRFILPYWISFDQLTDTCSWNFTSSGEPESCHTSDPDFHPLGFNIDLYKVRPIRFPDIVSFNFTVSIDPDDKLPRGKGDVHSAAVGYVACVPRQDSYWGGSETYCGPFKGIQM